MKQKIQLSFVLTFAVFAVFAQKKEQRTTAYAITAPAPGSSNWSEVKLIDLTTGEELKSVYKNAQEIPIINARTGQPIVKKSDVALQSPERLIEVRSVNAGNNITADVNANTNVNTNVKTTINTNTNIDTRVNKTMFIRVRSVRSEFKSDRPFATNSAACAYDKKNGRLFYTPMNINELRYIDLKSDEPKIGYFKDESFGVMVGRGDINNQITRMAFASDGNGYALTNDASHLIMFTSKKKIEKTEIVDLGALTDDAGNGSNSIHSRNGFGGDMIADESGNLYLITANRAVFKINIETKAASFLGSIKGLPVGYSTNGASVEKGTNIIVSSANMNAGFYKFDLYSLQAEKYSTGENVFNASDLANGNLISAKKPKKEEVKKEEPKVIIEEQIVAKVVTPETQQYKMAVYPNPATDGIVHISFSNCPAGKYNVQLMDLSGQVLLSQPLTINGKAQVQDLNLPKMIAKGSYLVKLLGEADKVVSTERVIVQ